MLITDLAIFLDCLGDDAFEIGGKIGVQADGKGGLAIENGIKDNARGFAAKRK